jgi:hypothetical protein
VAECCDALGVVATCSGHDCEQGVIHNSRSDANKMFHVEHLWLPPALAGTLLPAADETANSI